MQTSTNVIDKNWKALIKPNKLDITSNDEPITIEFNIESKTDTNG